MTLRQISPTPYLAHDTPLQGGIAGFANAYVGNTAFTYYNAIYRTQLPAEPKTNQQDFYQED